MALRGKRVKSAPKKSRAFWNRFYSSLAQIHLVDKCLLLLMFILLFQSVYTLFSSAEYNAGANSIDIIIRTSSASIFGYFLSANFMHHNIASKTDTAVPNRPLTYSSTPPPNESPQNRIGFALAEAPSESAPSTPILAEPPALEEKSSEVGALQIITTAGIAIFCLVALMLVRDMAGAGRATNASTTAVVTQFRDFVSACVGFLIGCPTSKPSR